MPRQVSWAAKHGLWQEQHADGEDALVGFVAGAGDMAAEEVLGDLDVDAGAVAGLAVGVDGAAVPDGLQGVDTGLDDGASRLAVDRGDKADAAGVVLVRRIVHAVFGKKFGIALVAQNVHRSSRSH